MSGLEAFLICDIDDEIPLNKIFPLYYNDQSNLSDLLIIAQNFKKCGKGCLQHKNKIFYYRTFIPTLPKTEGNSNSNESFSDYFIYSYDYSWKKLFLLFLCDTKYKQKYIDALTSEIFEILDKDAFQGLEIKNESCHLINSLFEKYKKIEPNLGMLNPLTEINSINNSNDSFNDIADSSKKKAKINKKRIDSRMVLSKQKKKSTTSLDIDDLTSVKESDTDLSLMFKKNFGRNLFLPQVNKWKSIKIINIILCFVLFIIMLVIIIFFFK